MRLEIDSLRNWEVLQRLRGNGSFKIEHCELSPEGDRACEWIGAHYSRAKQCRERLCTRESVRGNNPGTSAGTGYV